MLLYISQDRLSDVLLQHTVWTQSCEHTKFAATRTKHILRPTKHPTCQTQHYFNALNAVLLLHDLGQKYLVRFDQQYANAQFICLERHRTEI